MSEKLQRHQMWTTILDLVIDSIGNQQLDGILDVIRNNLLYEDPGLLSASIDDDCNEIMREESLNIWLLNQVKQNETTTYDERAIEKFIEFQKDILSASLLLKQNIFKILLKNYIQYTRDLTDLNSFAENTILEVFYTTDNKSIKEFQPNAVYNKIIVKNNSKREQLLEINLKILVHIVPSLDVFEELYIVCSNCILDAFDKFQMSVKFLCLDYILEMLKTNFLFGQQFLVDFFHLCQKLVEILPLNNEFELFNYDDLDKFGIKLKKILQTLLQCYSPNQNKSNGNEKKIIFILLNILRIISSKEYKKFSNFVEYIFEIMLEVVLCFNKNNNLSFEYDECKEIYKSADNCPKLLKILKWTITNQLVNLDNSRIIVKNYSNIWINIQQILLNILNSSIFETDEMVLSTNIILLKEIFDLINNINFCYAKYQNTKITNRSHDSGNKELIFIKNSIDFEKLINDFIENVKAMKYLKSENYFHLIEFINLLIQSSEFHKFNADLQTNIINIILQYVNLVINIGNSFPFENIKDKRLDKRVIEILSNINVEYLKSTAKQYLLDSLKNIIYRIFVREDLQELQETVLNRSLCFLFNKSISVNILETKIIKPILNVLKKPEMLLNNLKNYVCLFNEECFVLKKFKNHLNIYEIICKKCDLECKNRDCENIIQRQLIQNNEGIIIDWNQHEKINILKREELSVYFDFLNESNVNRHQFALILNHCEFQNNENILKKWTLLLPNIIEIIVKSPSEIHYPILENFIKDLLKLVDDCLQKNNKDDQKIVLNIIRKFAFVNGIPEKIIFYLFKLTIMFLVRYESQVSQEASLLAIEMCHKHYFEPKNFLNWYKRDIFKLIISLCANMYLSYGLGLQKSLNCVSRMLGYKGPREFTYTNYQIIVTMLIQFCIFEKRCEDLLNEVILFTKMDLCEILKKSFLSFYLEYFIDKKSADSNACLDYIIEKTGCDIFSLMNLNIKKSVAKMLIYYHKNPNTIIKTFRCVSLRENNGTISPTLTCNIVPSQSTDVIKFIADRFLCVITYFEIYLMNPDFEKSLKIEILRSLGEIIRFLGSKYITPFHFKILAMLTTIITLDDDNLKEICINVWKIFVHNVDVQILGPSLSRIVAALEPLLIKNETEVNSIYKFLILTNGNLLSMHIPDLYFIENLKICKVIKQFVTQQIEKKWQTQNLLDKMKFFIKEIVHENVIIRVNGLIYLKKLFAENRLELNRMILGQNFISPVLETILKNLIIGCKHVDNNLKLASGKCIGELGAIEPGLMRPNYSHQKDNFPLDIHSDVFAIMALKELCKAYQFQKDTLYVDNFSLGIQEILVARGVCPKKKTKMEVWEAIPERMRQIMEPLLTSSYTGMQKNENSKVHPVFGSSCSKNEIEWAFNWSSNMIDYIEDVETKHLLNSLLPSIRRDNNILDIFLPYIILHALQNSSQTYRDRIYEELNFIFSSVLNNNNNCSYQDSAVNNKYLEFPFLEVDALPLQKFKSNCKSSFEIINDNIGIKCAKISFEILDFLEKWMREFLNIYSNKNDSTFLTIEKFTNNFNNMELALANYNCGEYARALKYCETFIDENTNGISTQNNEKIQEHLSFLIKIYVELMDSDSLEGAIYLKKSQSSLKEQILVYSMTDKSQETAACYEQLIKELESSNDLVTLDANDWNGFVQCFLRMDTPETALLISQGIMQKLGEKVTNEYMKESQAEPLWRLGRFEELGELLDKSDREGNNNWQIQCGRALLLFHRSNEISFDKFEMHMDVIRQDVLKVMKFGGTDCNSYHKGYSQVTRLHLLSDIEKARIVINNIYINIQNETECIEILKSFFNDWNARLVFLQQTIKIMEPLLCIRRSLLTEAKRIMKSQTRQQNVVPTLENIFNEEIGKLWILSVQHYRKAGCYQQAHLCILNAEKYRPNNLFIEKAKLYWKKGDQTNCFKVIEEKINEFEKNGNIEQLSTDNRMIYADAKFLQASYNAESMNISSDLNIKYFQQSLKYNAESEKCYVSMAQYYDRIYATMTKDIQKTETGERYLLYVMYNYGKSMFYGCEFMYQSMPRMLSIWFDINVGNQTSRKVSKINEFMEKCSQSLPLFLFFTAFSQLVSRICHPSDDVWKILKTIVIRLIEKYPQRSLWMILPVFKSSLTSRVRRCADIFSDKRLRQSNMQKLIKDFNSLADKLIELTNIGIPKAEQFITVSKLIATLPKLLADPDLSPIMMPIEHYMKMTLPELSERSKAPNQFNPFPNNIAYIKGIREEITILNSLQKPKKVTLIGSDGKDYTIMLKPKDDLRKDFRLMEFNSIVKQYLYQDPQARLRRLDIRTYGVLPLNEECGIIEWVDNLKPFRQIILDIYKKRKQGMNNKELKKYMNKEENPIKRREIYLNELLPKHPPVFNEWFLQRFANPHNWYQARTSYIRSTAVMSIVGYILGLGDRHGENILFDGSTGDIVHVDFNCLFNRGETFQFPEKVPFRLTHNMVHAMGALGIEGPYRKCCEITMKVLQSQTPILMSVLKPFIYDPLVTWDKRHTNVHNIERTDDSAISNVKRIEARLNGFVNFEEKGANMPLSAEGVVNYVILKAIDIDNLASMYIGWGPFM